MKYIDADKLIAEIERQKNQTERRLDNIIPIRRKDTIDEEQLAKIELRDKVDKAYLNGVLITLSDVLSFIDSLQQEMELPEKYQTPDWLFEGQEQPVEGLEEEQTCKGFEEEFRRFIKKEKEKEPDGSLPCYGDYGIYRIARHFAEWGGRTLKEIDYGKIH